MPEQTAYNTLGSFVASLFIYIFILLFLLYKISTTTEITKYTNQKDVFIDVYMVSSVNSSVQNKAENTTQKTEEISTASKIDKNPEQAPAKSSPDVNLNDLFNTVSVPSVPLNRKTKKASDILKNLNISAVANGQNAISSSPPKSATGVYDEYYGTITEIIQSKWVMYKANTDDSASVTIYINNLGKINYKINTLSYNAEFNKKVSDFLNILMGQVTFPPPPDNKTKTINLKLTDKIGA